MSSAEIDFIRKKYAALIALPPENQRSALEKVLLCSPFVADLWLAKPEWCETFFSSQNQADWRPDQFCYQLDALEATFMQQIRQWRMQQMAVIAARELLNIATTEVCCHAVSNLADQAIIATQQFATQQTLQQARYKSLKPEDLPDLITLGMGKLGGKELNYSSDIDLIFFYDDTDKPQQQIEWQPLLSMIVQKMIKYIGAITEHGFVFRVDTRLRPFGDSGALVLSLTGVENYYTIHGRDWERYALIKARAITGSEIAQQRLAELLSPFVYRRYLDFGSLEAMRQLKMRIVESYSEEKLQGNIKLGRGGIREVEFIFQLLQLTYAGKQLELQTTSLVTAANKVAEHALMDKTLVQYLLDAYWFLRKLENSLQIMRDQQVHTLPTDKQDQQRLAVALGYAGYAGLLGGLQSHQQHIIDCFDNVLYADSGTDDVKDLAKSLWLNPSQAQAQEKLVKLGYKYSDILLEQLSVLQNASVIKRMSEIARNRLDDFMATLLCRLKELNEYDSMAAKLWPRLQLFIKKIALRSAYLVMLTERKEVLDAVLNLFIKSDWVAETISSHPAMLDVMLEQVEIDTVTRASLQHDLAKVLSVAEDVETQMDIMRRFKHETVLQIACADLNSVLPLMKVSDALTFLSESLLDQAMTLSRQTLVEQYGEPEYILSLDNQEKMQRANMIAVGYGKMGGLELGYSSDLDIVFLHDSHGSEEYTSGAKRIDNTTFFVRYVQKSLHYLNTMMHNGRLYEVDMRLRPNGASGVLATRINGYMDYLCKDAWIWELQALVRARFVAGHAQLGQQFERLRKELICLPRGKVELKQQIVDMRLRMRKELGSKHGRNTQEGAYQSIRHEKIDYFDLKQDFGGIADIEFMVQYAVLANAVQTPLLADYTDNIRLLELLAQHAYIGADDAQALIDVYQLFRQTLHHRSLQNQDKNLPELNDELVDAVDTVSEIWLKVMY